ncbi:hypothetical protein Plhal703r1_c19g0086431 [Plasmopara halstedii]
MSRVVEVFEYEGCFSFLHEPRRFTFKIYSDHYLYIGIDPACSNPQREAIDLRTFPQENLVENDDVQAERRHVTQHLDSDINSTPLYLVQGREENEDARNTKLLAYDGRALVVMPSDGHDETCYMVHFKLVQWEPGTQIAETQIIKCIAQLSRKRGLSGRFVDIQESMEEAQDFTLNPIAHRFETLTNVLHPLTPGQYELRGITIAENAVVYECIVRLTLFADGMVSGTSRELTFAQECPISGMWTRFGITYLLKYEMHGSQHSYIYYTTPFQSCLYGTWENAKLQMLGISSQAEHGILEFQLVHAVRVWSEAYHKDYPKVFQECVKLLLLASLRSGILPSHLWHLIVVYCGYDWFRRIISTFKRITTPRRFVNLTIMAGKSSISSAIKNSPAASLLPLECVYDGCVGGFLAEKSRIFLRIESDWSVHGQVRRQPCGSLRILANGRKRKRKAVTYHPDGIIIAHIVGNARVVPFQDTALLCPSAIRGDGTSMAEYCCTLEITKRLDHVDRHTLTCHLHVPVASDVPALGTWRCCGGTLSSSSFSQRLETVIELQGVQTVLDEKVFQLQPVQWYQRQQEAEEAERRATTLESRLPSLLYPLRPGKYEFRGFSTYDTPSVVTAPWLRNGRRGRLRPIMATKKDECLVTLRLFPDGSLRGTSREFVQPQVCSLTGRWQANRIVYVLEYHVREAVGHFRYSGAVRIKGETTNTSNTEVVTAGREMVCGKWYNVDEGHAAGFEGGHGKFTLELVRVDYSPITDKREKVNHAFGNRHRQSGLQRRIELDQKHKVKCTNAEIDDDDDVIRAFTTGMYDLSGCATDAEGYEYAFDLQLQLHTNGDLSGLCKERIIHQISPVFGRWTPLGITYSQQYVVNHEVGTYTYAGDLSNDGAVVRGTWTNTEDDAALVLSEHGTFALILVNTKRQWSAISHVYYPPSFRHGVFVTLMASARRNQLPVALWTRIFAFCNEKWFTSLL